MTYNDTKLNDLYQQILVAGRDKNNATPAEMSKQAPESTCLSAASPCSKCNRNKTNLSCSQRSRQIQ